MLDDSQIRRMVKSIVGTLLALNRGEHFLSFNF